MLHGVCKMGRNTTVGLLVRCVSIYCVHVCMTFVLAVLIGMQVI